MGIETLKMINNYKNFSSKLISYPLTYALQYNLIFLLLN